MNKNPISALDPKIIEDMLEAFARAGETVRPGREAPLPDIQAANLAAFSAATAASGEAFYITAQAQVDTMRELLDAGGDEQEVIACLQGMMKEAEATGLAYQKMFFDLLARGGSKGQDDE